MLDDAWWDVRTHPAGVTALPDADALEWRRVRLAYDLVMRWHLQLGIEAHPHQPTHGAGGAEPVMLMSPLCRRSPTVYADLPTGVAGLRPSGLSQLATRTPGVGQLASPARWSAVRMSCFEALDLTSALSPGHERCFHRRGKDAHSLALSLALLLRTHDGQGWAGPLTWDTLHEPMCNGHTYSALAVQELPREYRSARAIAVWSPEHWRSVALTNDGLAFVGDGDPVDVAEMWRGGADVFAIAADLRRRAHLPPLHA